jgi:hypothetical protein
LPLKAALDAKRVPKGEGEFVSNRTEHVETLQGRGTLILPDNTCAVEYLVRIFQNYSDDTPGLKQAAGSLAGFEKGDVVFTVLAGQPLELVLADGRCARIILAGLEGDFEVIGPIVPKGE